MSLNNNNVHSNITTDMIRENMEAGVDLMNRGVRGMVKCLVEIDKNNAMMSEMISVFKLPEKTSAEVKIDK